MCTIVIFVNSAHTEQEGYKQGFINPGFRMGLPLKKVKHRLGNDRNKVIQISKSFKEEPFQHVLTNPNFKILLSYWSTQIHSNLDRFLHPYMTVKHDSPLN